MPNGKIKTIEEALKRPEIFRVSLFGSARTKPGDPEYELTYDLAYQLGKKDISVVTGGGPGQMNAANEGHKKACSRKTNSIGLTIELPWEPEENENLDIKAHFKTFGDRLDHFMLLSNAVVITPGGIGTCLELFYTLQLTQVKHICPIPIILFDKMWTDLYKWIEENPVARGFISPRDLDNIFVIEHVNEVLDLINQCQKAFKTGDGKVCINAKVYEITTKAEDNVLDTLSKK